VRSYQVLTGLGSANQNVRQTAAMAVGKFAAIEIPQKSWEGLIEALVKNAQNTSNANLRESSFTTLGYICEEAREIASVARVILLCLFSLFRFRTCSCRTGCRTRAARS
jgi:hypothetical protein